MFYDTRSNVDKYIANQLVTCRRNAGLNLHQVANCLGVSSDVLYEYESGFVPVPAATAFCLSELYEVSIGRFLPE